jgi:ABC-type sugar transport system permease subunit
MPNAVTSPAYAMPALIVANVWHSYPLVMVFVLAALQTVPAELYEAARIDGASAWQRFRLITLPMVRNTTLVVLVLTTLHTFNNVTMVFIMTGGGRGSTEDLGASGLPREFKYYQTGIASAAAVVIFSLNLLFSLAYVRVLRATSRRVNGHDARTPATSSADLRLLGLASVFALVPLLWGLSTSLKPLTEVNAYPPTWIPAHPRLENYVTVLSNPKYIRYLLNTLGVSPGRHDVGIALSAHAPGRGAGALQGQVDAALPDVGDRDDPRRLHHRAALPALGRSGDLRHLPRPDPHLLRLARAHPRVAAARLRGERAV